MPSKAYTSAGTTISVSESLPETPIIDEFDILIFTDVGEVSDIGDFGATSEVLSHYELGSNEPKKVLGNTTFGGLTLRMAVVRSNDGQNILQQARRNRDRLSFQITVPEPDVYYFTGYVTDYQVSIGGPDQIVSASLSITLDSEFVVDEDALII